MRQDKQDHVKIGDVYQIEITDLTHDGEGVGKVSGLAVFVPDAIPGDVVYAQVISVKKSYARALIQSIFTPSKQRIEPSCPVATQCGGCQLGHMDYKAQLSWKQKHVQNVLQRIGKIDATVEPIIGMDHPLEYRNKSQFPIGQAAGELTMGFYQKRSHDIVDYNQCEIQHPVITAAAWKVKAILTELNIKPYNEQSHTGVLRHVVFRVSYATNELMLIFITNTKQLPDAKNIIERIQKDIPEVRSIVHNINPHKTNVIFGSQTKILWGEPYLTDRIGSLSFFLSPRSFFQVNPLQTQVLYDEVKRVAALTGSETIWDLYCGIGTIGLYLAKQAKSVIGVETVPEAITDAKLNAEINKIDHATFYVGKAEDVAPKLVQEHGQPDLILVDPPRKGCEQSLLETIAKIKVDKVVYVSCNPATLARDLGYLTEHGYQVQHVQPVDMFPQTTHVECVSQIIRKS